MCHFLMRARRLTHSVRLLEKLEDLLVLIPVIKQPQLFGGHSFYCTLLLSQHIISTTVISAMFLFLTNIVAALFQQCDPEKLITESKFLQLESLQELMKVLYPFWHPFQIS